MRSHNYFVLLLSLVFGLIVGPCLGQPADKKALLEKNKQENLTGQDFTRPFYRFDIRQQYLFDAADNEFYITTLRLDAPIPMGSSGWLLAARGDVTFVQTDKVSSDNPNGKNTFGLGDSFFQTALVTPTLADRVKIIFGSQFVVPTALDDNTGGNLWRVLPVVAASVNIDEVSKGSKFLPVLRWSKSVGSVRNGTSSNDLEFAPTTLLAFPKGWFVQFWAKKGFRVNFDVSGAKRGGTWHAPFDLLVGKMVTKNVIVSLEYSVPLIRDFQLFEHFLEFRAGIFF